MNDSILDSRDSVVNDEKKKKPTRDPYAHRKVEKIRRDRMNEALNRLGSKIPDTFLKQGQSRLDKIRVVDMAVSYIEHLENQIKNLNQQIDINNQSSKDEKSSSKNDDDHNRQPSLWYTKGLFEGSIQLFAYLHTQGSLNLAAEEQYVNGERPTSFIIRINSLKVAVYKYVHFMSKIDKNRNYRSMDGVRLVEKMVMALSSDHELELKFCKTMLKMLDKNDSKTVVMMSSIWDESSSESSSEEEANPVGEKYRRRNGGDKMIVIEDNDSNSQSSNENECQRSKDSGIHRNRIKPKSDFIQRFDSENSSNLSCFPASSPATSPVCSVYNRQSLNGENFLVDDPSMRLSSIDNCLVSKASASRGCGLMVEARPPKNRYLSVFIMHPSQDFYIGGCMEQSLVAEDVLKNVINNMSYRPSHFQKVNLDVALSPGLTISKEICPVNSDKCSTPDHDCENVSSESAHNNSFNRAESSPKESRRFKAYKEFFEKLRFQEYRTNRDDKMTNKFLINYLGRERKSYTKPTKEYKNYSNHSNS